MSTGTFSENIHLVIFSEEFYPNTSGGAHERWTFAQKAVHRGDAVTVFTMRDPGTVRFETVDGVEIVRPTSGSPSFVPVHSKFSLPFRLVSSIIVFLYALIWSRQRGIDSIHSTNHSFHWVAKTLSRIYNIPLINYVAFTPSIRESSSSFKRALEHLNFKFFMGETVYCRAPRAQKAVRTAGHRDVRILHGIINSDVIYAVSDVDAMEIRSMYGVAENDLLISFVGRFVPIKRPEAAVEVCRSLSENHQLLMIGDGPEWEKVERQVRDITPAARPILTGELSHQETLERIKASDILLLTSEAEAYPTVVFEALALGAYVVAPPVGVLASIRDQNLHLAPVKNQTDTLRRLKHGSYKIRDDIVRAYSMDRFTDEILTRSHELAAES